MQEVFLLFVLGVVNGATLCSLSCFHYLGPYLMGSGGGFGSGLQMTGKYLLGKCLTYSLLAALSAWVGESLESWMAGYGALLLAVSLILLGLSLPWIKGSNCPRATQRQRSGASLFFLGITGSLIPCPALGVVLLTASQSGTALAGLSLGAAYGLGLVCSPMLPLGGGLSLVGRKLGHHFPPLGRVMPWLQSLVIVTLGVKLLVMGV